MQIGPQLPDSRPSGQTPGRRLLRCVRARHLFTASRVFFHGSSGQPLFSSFPLFFPDLGVGLYGSMHFLPRSVLLVDHVLSVKGQKYFCLCALDVCRFLPSLLVFSGV